MIFITDNTNIGAVSEKLICRISQLLDTESVSAQGIKSLTSALKDLKDLRDGGGEDDYFGILILPEADTDPDRDGGGNARDREKGKDSEQERNERDGGRQERNERDGGGKHGDNEDGNSGRGGEDGNSGRRGADGSTSAPKFDCESGCIGDSPPHDQEGEIKQNDPTKK